VIAEDLVLWAENNSGKDLGIKNQESRIKILEEISHCSFILPKPGTNSTTNTPHVPSSGYKLSKKDQWLSPSNGAASLHPTGPEFTSVYKKMLEIHSLNSTWCT